MGVTVQCALLQVYFCLLGLGGTPPAAFLVKQAPKQGDMQELVRTGLIAYSIFRSARWDMANSTTHSRFVLC